MTEVSKFFDAVSYTEADQAEVQARFRPTGVMIEVGNRLTLTSPGGMFVGVADGEAMVEGFHYKNTALLSLAIANNSSGSTRIDRIVLRLNRTTNSLVAAILQGTPGAGAPALTQVAGGTYELLLGQVTVANGAVTITPMLVADNRTYSGSSVGSSLNSQPIAPLGYVAPRPNRIDNPSMRVNQHGTGVLSGAGYVGDRWLTQVGTNGFAFSSQLLDVAPPNMGFVVGETAKCVYTIKGNNTAPVAGDLWGFMQSLEGLRAEPLYGLPICVSWWSYSDKTGTYGFNLDQTNTTYKYIASWVHGLANGWQFNYISVPFSGSGAPSANWLYTNASAMTVRWILGAGSTAVHTATNLWTNGLSGKYVGNDFSSGLTATNNGIWIYQPKIESGLYPTRFEVPSLPLEQTECLRYFYRLNIVSSSSASAYLNGFAVGVSTARILMPFPVPMRATPAMSFDTPSHYAVYSPGAGQVSVTAISNVGNTPTSAQLSATVGSSIWTAGQSTMLVDNSFASFIDASAEI